jgi:hypothetical protein
MTRKPLPLLVAALAALSVTALTVAPAPAKHGDNSATKLEGRVLSVNRTAHTFRLRDSELGTLGVRWNKTTTFDGIRSSQVRPGKILEVHFRLVNGRRLATKIQQGAGNHG